jgi:phosphatidylserine decarboxylase
MAALGASGKDSSSSSSDSFSSVGRSGLGVGRRALWVLLYLLPKNAISRMAGRFALLRLPPILQRAEIRLFARYAGVDLDEAAEPVDAYPSLQEFFTRALRDGARPIEGGPEVLVSPCDGTWGAAGPIDGGTLLQVKGRTYRVRDLLGDVDAADAYEGGYFATFYLSPRDYHRLHMPTAGRIRRLGYIPGGLWPVNSIGLQGIDALFATNERICAYLEPDGAIDPGDAYEVVGATASELGPGAIAMVAVGATMVGSVRLRFDDMTTNRAGAVRETRDLGPDAPHFKRGEEWGHFEFGSTIVMLIPPESFELDLRPAGTALRLGEAIGQRSVEAL